MLRIATGFTGQAAIVVGGTSVRLADFAIDGNREALETPSALPPSNTPFTRFTEGNGVLAEGGSGLTIENVRFRNIGGFALLASRAHGVTVRSRADICQRVP
jgi:hypothetical protein